MEKRSTMEKRTTVERRNIMENYKDTLRKRMTFFNSFNCLALFFIVLTGYFGDMAAGGSKKTADAIHGFQVGIFIGFQLAFLINISKYRRALKSDVLLNKLYIEENNERTKMIQAKIGGTGFNFVLVVIAAAAIIAGFLNQTVFFTLFGVLSFAALVKGALIIYYRKKF